MIKSVFELSKRLLANVFLVAATVIIFGVAIFITAYMLYLCLAYPMALGLILLFYFIGWAEKKA